MINNQSYRDARHYAYKLDFEKYMDILHDTYIRWHEKRGGNLFDEHQWVIRAAIKNTWLNTFARNRFTWRGDKYKREFMSIAEDIGEGVNVERVPVYSIDPEQEMIFQESLQQLESIIFTKKQREALKYIMQGYKNVEVAEMTGISLNTVTRTFSALEDRLNKRRIMYTNPFRASKTVVKKKIGEVAWSRRKDHSDFEFEVDNEEYQLYVHKESKEGWLVKIVNPKSSDFYIKNLVDREKEITLPKFKD